MMLTARLSAYLFKIGQKLYRGEYVPALMVCPECDTKAADMGLDHADQHILIDQKIYNNNNKYKVIRYVVVGCEGYWVVDPAKLGLPRGNWQPLVEVIKEQRAK